MKERVTIFHAEKARNKVPLSPFFDKTFVFETYEATSNLQMFSVLVKHFILNIPLTNTSEPIRTERRKNSLDPYYHHCNTYYVLDIDDVKCIEDRNKILEYFKEYKVILGASKSYNNINNFNMKGILFTECIPLEDLKLGLSEIHHDLMQYCTIDESVTRKASLNAPINKNEVFLNNENGKRFSFEKRSALEHINEVKKDYVGDGIEFPVNELQDIKADSIEKLCLSVFQTMGFTALKNNPNGAIVFKHPTEEKTVGGYFWFSSSPYTMHHWNSTKTVNIFDSVRKLDAAKELMKKTLNYDDEFLNFNTSTNVVSVNEKYLEVTQDVSDAVETFLEEKDGLLSIRSPMGTGKSTIIRHVIEEAHEKDMKVLIVTNRISVAQDFGKKYGMKVYNADKYNLGDSLVCQYDSLWKYDIKRFDLIVMDEFISLMMHARSNLSNNSLNISKFFAAFSKKLVIADAFLTGYENFLLQNKDSNIHLIDNNYRDPCTLYSYTDMNYFVNSLIYAAENNKITVSGTSLSFINSLSMLLIKKGLKVVTLTAETPDSTKKLVYDLFEKEDHDKFDVLIYSPTLTVGVSNLNNVPLHFHYDSAMSTDVVSSIQMIKRTRRAKEIHMFVKERTNYLKTSYNDIRDEYMQNMGKNIQNNYLFDIDNYGNSKLSEIGKKAIKIDTFKNILEFNHKDAMFWLMKYHFMKEPRIISNTFSGNVLHRYSKIIREDRKAGLLNNIEQFMALNDIEKTGLLMDDDVDKTMRVLAEIDDQLKECPGVLKSKILELALKDGAFIQKCKYFKVVFNYGKKIWDESDVRSLVSKAVLSKNTDDLQFWNALLAYGQKEMFDEYLPKHVNADKRLKYILDRCGYRVTRRSEPGVIGHRGYCVDPNVKEYYGYIKT